MVLLRSERDIWFLKIDDKLYWRMDRETDIRDKRIYKKINKKVGFNIRYKYLESRRDWWIK